MKFYIRDVLWLTVVIGFAAAWWISHRRESARNHDLLTSLQDVESAMERHGFLMEVDLQTGKASWSFVPYRP